MNFLKKESKDLKFKDNKDSFDSIPPPPNNASQGDEQTNSSVPPFPDAQQKDSMPPGAEEAPTKIPENNDSESLFPKSQNDKQDHSEYMPQGNFNEQPESPESFMSSDIGWSQDPAYTNSQDLPETDFSQEKPEATNPFEEDSEDLSLPDLPDIPDSAMTESLGVNAESQEESNEQKGFAEVNESQSNVTQQGKKSEAQEAELPDPEAQEPSDDLPELEAEYLPEEEAIEEEEKEQFVESHHFYETLQDIKALKRGLKDADSIMKEWSELDDKVEEEAEKFIETIDTLQEEMIKIDSALFEEE